MNKKAGTPLAILFIVIATLALFSFALFTFLTKENEIATQIQSSKISDSINVRAAQINFHIAEIAKKAAQRTAPTPNAESEFLANFQEELDKLALLQVFPELETLPPQLDASKVKIEGSNLTLTLKFKIEKVAKVEETEAIRIEYIYEKNFTQQISEKVL